MALRARVDGGLDRLYGVVPVRSNTGFTFPADPPVQLEGLVRGYDGAPTCSTAPARPLWRIDLAKKAASPVAVSGQKASGTNNAEPKVITTGGPDVVVLDTKNALWRWRPVHGKGKGTLVKIEIADSSSWGDDIEVMSTFVANFDAALYKLYIVDPSEQNIRVVSPVDDGSGYRGEADDRLPTDRPVDGITDLLLDGDIFVAENGGVARVIPASGWSVSEPKDTQVRPEPELRAPVVSGPSRRLIEQARGPAVRLRPHEPPDRRVQQGRRKVRGAVPAGRRRSGAGSDLRDMVVLPGRRRGGAQRPPGGSPSTGLHSVVLTPAEGPAATPTPSPTATPAPTKKPAKTPKPKKTPKP